MTHHYFTLKDLTSLPQRRLTDNLKTDLMMYPVIFKFFVGGPLRGDTLF